MVVDAGAVMVHMSEENPLILPTAEQAMELLSFKLDGDYDPRLSGILPFHFGSNGSRKERFWKFISGSFFQKEGAGNMAKYRQRYWEEYQETSRVDVDLCERRAHEAFAVIAKQHALHHLHANGVVLLGNSGGGQVMGRTSRMCQDAGIEVLAEIYLSSVPDWSLPLSGAPQSFTIVKLTSFGSPITARNTISNTRTSCIPKHTGKATLENIGLM